MWYTLCYNLYIKKNIFDKNIITVNKLAKVNSTLSGFSARGNLEETFETMENIYSIDDIENGVMERIFMYKKKFEDEL